MIGPIPDFPGLLAQVAPHAASLGGVLPQLEGVALETDNQHVYALATDRSTLAVARRRITHTSPGFSAFLSNDQLKVIRAVTRLKGNRDVTLTVAARTGPPTLRMQFGQQQLVMESGVPHKALLQWRELLARHAFGPNLRPAAEVTLHRNLLGRWAHAVGNGGALTVWTAGDSDTSPLVVAAPDFLGLQMPLRSPDPESRVGRAEIRNAWAGTLSLPPRSAIRAA